ncbi:nitroreductase family protein [Parapedobacter koreensis]|uniref:Nitroreductase n=1 Tax=Parapedobacter koreensis TaxID=332977 RepID=A0A1H7T784_9SPHI|nr:nitroreductase family protein [Parapedobacter koreensis]SEL80379.1 Nitroreductase [Parapedobacter koreensis]
MNTFLKYLFKIRTNLSNAFIQYLGRYIGLSGLYYTFLSSAFARERRAVLAGKLKHLEETKRLKSNYFLLVRNTHRLEKGLLMRPRRAIFAVDYIEETIDCFVNIYKTDTIHENNQLKWFRDVLELYFKSVEITPFLSTQQDRFIKHIQASIEALSVIEKSVPYCRILQDQSTISFEEFYKLAKQRRSVRWFLDRSVSRELIDKAVLVANQSPSACNRQPFEYRIFDDPKLVKELVNYPMGTKGYGHSIPVMIVVVGNLDAYFDERDRHVIYIDASLANMSLMLALETLGLSSCSINWPDIEARERKMEKFLKLEKYQRPIMCIGVGYPDPEGMVAFSEKRPLSQIRKYNI